MAPTDFTTMLHSRTNKITRVLIYAVLEWTLIFLLLLNSLFSYFILKFALYFGLKPPCLFCSRLDHLLGSQKNHNKTFLSYKDIICEQHAAEISDVGYCTHHRTLVQSRTLCDQCSSTVQKHDQQDFEDPLFRWMKKIGIVGPDEGEDGDIVKTCSCCDVVINTRKKIDSCSLGFMANLVTEREFAGCFPDQETGDLVLNQRDFSDQTDFGYHEVDDVVEVLETEKQPLISSNDDDDVDVVDEDDDMNKEIVSSTQNLCPDMLPQHLEFYVDHDDYRLIPVGEKQDENSSDDCEKRENPQVDLVFEKDELMGGNCEVSGKNLPSIQEEDDEDEEENENKSSGSSENGGNTAEDLPLVAAEEEKEVGCLPYSEGQVEKKMEEETANKSSGSSENGGNTAEDSPLVAAEEEKVGCLPYLEGQVEEMKMEGNSEISEFPQVQEEEKREIENLCASEEQEKKTVAETAPNQAIDTESEAVSDIQYAPAVYNEDTESQLRNEETEIEKNENVTEKILIEMEEHLIPSENVCSTITESAACEVTTCTITDDKDGEQAEAEAEAEAEVGKDTAGAYVEVHERSLNVNVGLSSNEVEEDRFPETPTSVDNFHHLHKKLLPLGRRGSVTEESLDGSIISEHEGGDGDAMLEKLKLELQAEKKALRALYVELEEERNASAISANQTMAMITRLQEEKATMQMEALQYQRMMEEQSEYDQEALQMMNELMVKREKEKLELEKELEVYRKKLVEFEEREKMRILSKRQEGSMRSRNSSASCSYGEDSDGISVDLNHEPKDQDEEGGTPHSREENGHQDTPTDAVLGLHDSLASFEEERESILEQLKLLEEKLFTLAEEEEEHAENMKPFEQFCEENGKDLDDSCYNDSSDANGGESDFMYQNGKHRLNGSMQKRLLPLFDAAELPDSADGALDENGHELDMVLNKSPITKFELEKKKLAIEEEVEHVYERLQALEADREFLKHCMGSLRKGDKGLDLLQEILQHLRDLKNVELQVMKNMDLCASV